MYSKTELKFMYKNLAHDFAETGKLLPELRTILNLLSKDHEEGTPATLDMVVPMEAFVTFMNAIPQGQSRANKYLKSNCPAKPFCIRASQTSLMEHVCKVKGKKFDNQELAFRTAKATLGKEDTDLLDYNDLCTFFTYFRFCKDCMKNGLIKVEDPESDDLVSETASEAGTESEAPESQAPTPVDTPRAKPNAMRAIANMVMAVRRKKGTKDQECQSPESKESEEEKDEEARTEEAKPEEAKPEEAKPEEEKPAEAKPEEAKTEEARTEEARTEEARTEEAKAAEAKAAEAKAAEAKVEEVKTEEAKTGQEHITIEISEQAKI